MFNSVRLARKIPLFSNFTQSDRKQEFFQLEIKKKVLLGVIEKTHIEKSVFLFLRAELAYFSRKSSTDSRSNVSLHY